MILRRLPGSRFSEVLRAWEGETAVLLGGGPSLTQEQVETVRQAHQEGRCRTIAVNDAYLLAQWADVCYFADSKWWNWQIAGVAKPTIGLTGDEVRQRFWSFAGQKCSIQASGGNITDEAVHIMRNRDYPVHGNVLSDDSHFLATGRNSSYQALNLAILAGAKTVILLGVDGQKSPDGKTHWHGSHERPTPEGAYAAYRRAFSEAAQAVAAAGVRVINASPSSAVGFERMDIADALMLAHNDEAE